MPGLGWRRGLVVLMAVFGLASCRKAGEPRVGPIPAGMVDRTFYSAALGREVTYRVAGSSGVHSAVVHVVYLLHGNGGGYGEWSQDSSLVRMVPRDYLLVMPEGRSSYFMNSANVKADRYEDFVTRDLIADAERDVRGAAVERAIVGNSMGGFAAIVLGMKHPGLYGFVGALSPPVDYAERPFSVRRVGQSMAIRSIFGAAGSASRAASDPFVLARTVDPGRVPFIFLSAGEQEPLLGPIRRFDALLTRRGIAHEFQVRAGGHDWGQWNLQMGDLAGALEKVEH